MTNRKAVPVNSIAPGTATVTQTGAVTNSGALNTPTLPGQTTAAPSPAATTTVAAANAIVLSIEAAAATGVPAINNTVSRKRQTSLSENGLGYVAADGVTGTCAAAKMFAVGNGELMDMTTGVLISADTELQPINVNDAVSEPITTNFAVVGGILVWTNSLFYNGTAVFCLLNDLLYATFNAAGPPAGCSVVNLVAVQGSLFYTLRESDWMG